MAAVIHSVSGVLESDQQLMILASPQNLNALTMSVIYIIIPNINQQTCHASTLIASVLLDAPIAQVRDTNTSKRETLRESVCSCMSVHTLENNKYFRIQST